MIRIIYHRAKCIGCNACVEAAPERWRGSKKDGRCNLVGGKGKKEIYHAIIDDDEYPQDLRAATNCPVKIISIERIK